MKIRNLNKKPLPSLNMAEEVSPIGLLIPGRPASPCDGRAQHYTRPGYPSQQVVRTFNNGTSIVFGPMDNVGDFRPNEPFYEQALLIQHARMDMLAAGAIMVGSQDQGRRLKDYTSSSTIPKHSDLMPNTTSGILGPHDYLRAGELGRRPMYSPSIYEGGIIRGLNTQYGTESPFGPKESLDVVLEEPGGGGVDYYQLYYGDGGDLSARGGGGGGGGKLDFQDYYRQQHRPYLESFRVGRGGGPQYGSHGSQRFGGASQRPRRFQRSGLRGVEMELGNQGGRREFDPDFYYGQY